MGKRINERVEALSPQAKRALLAQLYAGQIQKPKTAPLSLAQERILALCQLDPDDPGYNITTAYRLVGSLDVTVLEQGLNHIIRRQATLRTAFATVAGRPVQLITPELSLRLAVQDSGMSPADEQEEQIRQLVIRQARQPFDLSRAPLLRATLMRLSPEEHVLVLTTHRLVFDGQCWPVLITELVAFCKTTADSHTLALPGLPLQYADFAVWQRAWLQGDVLETQLAYWRERLNGKLHLLELPTDHPRALGQFRSELKTFSLSAEVSEALRTLSQQAGVSLFVILLAAFQVLLYTYTAQEDFLVFTSVAGRSRPELKGLIGLFANILALRVDLSGNPTFRDLVERVRDGVAGAYAHQDVPFEQILETLQIERDQRYASIFQAMFVFWPEPLPPVEWPGITLGPLDIDTKPAEFDLLLHVNNTRPAMTVMLRYKADLFEAATMTRLLERFQNLLTAITARPQQHIVDLTRLKAQAAQGSVTGSVPILPSQWSFLQTPDLWVNMVEVVELQQRLSPAVLARAVQHLWQHHDALRTRFVYEGQWQQFISAPNGQIPFTCIDLAELPAAEHQVALQAALATVQSHLGPLAEALSHVALFDLGEQRPGYLVFTVHHVISDNASLPILLEDLHTAYRQLDQGEPVRLLSKTTSVKAWAEQLDAYLQSLAFQQQLNKELALFRESSARLPVDYPEGRSHNTLASTAHVQVSLSAAETSLLLKEFPRVYKVWLMDILLAALVQAITRWSGARQVTLRLVDSGRNLDLPDLEEVDLSRTVGCLFVPGVLMLERPETADPIGALQAVKEQLAQFPTYGISVGVAQQLDRYPEARRLPPAELRLNYLGQPTLPEVGAWLPDTSTALADFVANRRHPNLDRNPVLLNCTAIVLAGQLTVDWEYSENLHRRDTLERVANDWLDALRALVQHYQLQRETAGDGVSQSEQIYVAPCTPTEEMLTDIWAQALGHARVGVHDNFFELGGDSLTGLRIMARINQLGLPLTPKKLFENQTVAELAALIDAASASQRASEPVTGPVPLTPAQHWFFEQPLVDFHHFSHVLLLEVKQRLEPALLAAAWQQLLTHHDGLRLRFEPAVVGWRQINLGPEETAPVTQFDLSLLAEREQDAAVERVTAQLQASLNLTMGPLLRVVYFDRGVQRPGQLLIILHHLIADAESWQILLTDLNLAYQQLDQGQTPRLPTKTTSFKRWAEQLSELAHSEEVREELSFWREMPSRPTAALPIDYIAGVNTLASAQTITLALDIEETQALLNEVPQVYQTRVEEVLVAALVQTLTQWAGEHAWLLDVAGSGREDQRKGLDLSRSVGRFAPIFPVRLDLKASLDSKEALLSIKEQLRRVPKRGVNYGVLRYLAGYAEVASELAAIPSPEISFNYLGQLDRTLASSPIVGPLLEFSGPHRGPEGARVHSLEIVSGVNAGRLQLAWTYSRNLHSHSTIEGLAVKFMEALRALIAHCQSSEVGAYTPSDFAEFEWGEEYFAGIAAEINKVIG